MPGTCPCETREEGGRQVRSDEGKRLEGANLSHLHAVLVHERPDCVLDLLRALRAQDPDSAILLYNGGSNASLLSGMPLEELRVQAHPSPRPMRWGRLHGFAIDCMRHALAHIPFDAMTMVGSDQMPLRRGWPEAVAAALAADPADGLHSSEPARQGIDSRIDPVRTLMVKRALWTPLLRRLPGGEAAFRHWTFWPGTVFTREAASALVALFDGDAELSAILAPGQSWATEEVLPTLVAALGFRIGRTPAATRWVQFRRAWTPAGVEGACANPADFWLHLVPRRIGYPLRVVLRGTCAPPFPGLLRTPSILVAMLPVEGWLIKAKADRQFIEGWRQSAERLRRHVTATGPGAPLWA